MKKRVQIKGQLWRMAGDSKLLPDVLHAKVSYDYIRRKIASRLHTELQDQLEDVLTRWLHEFNGASHI